MKKNLFLFCIVIILVPFLSFAQETVIKIKVDASQTIESVPEIFSPSMWIVNPHNRYLIEKFFSENNPKRIQISLSAIDFPLFARTESFKEYKQNLRKYFGPDGAAAYFIHKIKEFNTALVIGFDPPRMPSWLSSRPGDYRLLRKGGDITLEKTSPPMSYDLWAEVVTYTLTYFNNDLQIKNLGFFVGHEQDLDWAGSEKSFFRYYEYAAKAAKKVNPDIKVGGGGPRHWNIMRAGCDSKYYTRDAMEICKSEGGWRDRKNVPFLKNFIDYAVQNNVPLDFINWHSFGTNPEGFLIAGNRIKKWLGKKKLEDVRLYPSDWTYWSRTYPADYLDTTESAAYIPQALYYMWKGGIDWHGHDFDVEGYGMETKTIKKRDNSVFIGSWSIFARAKKGGIVKPTYNAFKALNMISREDKTGGSRLISTDFPEDETVVAFSTISGDARKIFFMMSNFIPKDKNKLNKYILGIAMKDGIIKEEVELFRKCIKDNTVASGKNRDNFAGCKSKLRQRTKDPEKLEVIDFTSKLFTCLKYKGDTNCMPDASEGLKFQRTRRTADKIKEVMGAASKSKHVSIEFINIPFKETAKLITYKIDSAHSNACSFNKKTEPRKTGTPCGVGGAIDKAVAEARKQARGEGLKKARIYLSSLGYEKKEIELLKNNIRSCVGRMNARNCLNELSERIGAGNPNRSRNIKNDLPEAFEKYKKTFQTSYYRTIDGINNWKEVSLEGSKEEKEVDIRKGMFILNRTVEPNSVYLLILEGS
ncbi:MAG TPA: hypothetical protein ENH01_01420 [Nitrospirae bacterium]|nr:hypothetical protein [Nitrospirota bacterium]HDZ00625.1 hypothetical protein [Nitrospirota bacterium]